MVWTPVTRTFFGGIDRATSVFGPHPARAAEKQAAINANFRTDCTAPSESSLPSIRAFCSTAVAFCRALAAKRPLMIVIEVVKVATRKADFGERCRYGLADRAKRWEAITILRPTPAEYERYSCQTECPRVEPPDTAEARRGTHHGGRRHQSDCRMDLGKRTEILRLALI